MSNRGKRFRWVPHIIRHDFWRKFFALIFAILVTATVYSDKRKHEDEVFVINNVQPTLILDKGYVWKTRNLQQVSLTLRGPRAKLFDLKPEDFTLNYILGENAYKSKNKNGKQFVKLQTQDVRCRHPKGALLRVEEITPAEYTFEIEKIVTKTLPLKAVWEANDLPEGYLVKSISFPDVKSVQVTGPAHLLSNLKQIQTMPVALKEQVADFTTNVNLKSLPGLTYSVDTVPVSVDLTTIQNRSFKDLPVYVMLPPEKSGSYTMTASEPLKVRINISGSKESVNDLTEHDIHPYIDLSKLTAGGKHNNVPVRCSVEKAGIAGILSITCIPAKISEITLTEKVEAKPEEKKPEKK